MRDRSEWNNTSLHSAQSESFKNSFVFHNYTRFETGALRRRLEEVRLEL